MSANEPSDSVFVAPHCASQNSLSMNAFKEAHMRYRRRPSDPNYVGDCHEMVDFGNHQNDVRILHVPSVPISSTTTDSFHEHNEKIYTGPLYGLVDYPGFIMAPNALSSNLQLLLAYAAVTTYCEFPHRTNFTDATPNGSLSRRSASALSLWEQWIEKNMMRGPLLKLSWSTLGFHYNWTQRSYHPDQQSPMPPELHRLASCLASTVHSRCHSNPHFVTTLPYEATAGIVNFYHSKSVMGGHRDDLELALHQPVISVSLGRPAVFLFGGSNLNDVPVLPIMVRAGDVIIFGGPCRLNYHSMARLLPEEGIPSINEFNPHQLLVEDILDEGNVVIDQLRYRLFKDPNYARELSALKCYLSDHRVNINLRQVYDTTTAGGGGGVENVDQLP